MTAEEFFKGIDKHEDYLSVAKAFARYHVLEALKTASVNLTDCHFSLSGWKSNKEEILEAYPLENIK